MARKMAVISIGILMLLGIFSTANASLVVYGSESFSDKFPAVGLQGVDWAVNLSVSKFNHPTWTLDKVTVNLDAAASGWAGVENIAPAAPTTITYFAGGANVAAGSGWYTVSTSPGFLLGAPLVLPKFDLVEDYLGLSGRTYTYSDSDSSSQSSSLAGDMAPFIGFGVVLIPASGTGYVGGFGVGGHPDFSGTAQASADVKVIYDYHYDQVPLPSALLLLGPGLLGLIGIRRRFGK